MPVSGTESPFMLANRRPRNSARLAGLPFTGHRSRFIVHSFLASLVVLAVVALAAAGWGFRAWAALYLLTGLWSLAFFALTPLIIKEAIFSRRPGRALALVALKFGFMGLMVGFCMAASSLRISYAGLALIAGVATPLAALTLRALGGLLAPSPRPANPSDLIGNSR